MTFKCPYTLWGHTEYPCIRQEWGIVFAPACGCEQIDMFMFSVIFPAQRKHTDHSDIWNRAGKNEKR